MPQSPALARLRGHLGKIDRTPWLRTIAQRKMAGDAGEFLTEILLDDLAIPWIRFDQHAKRYSKLVVGRGKAKRPDYLVRDGGSTYLIDSKHITLTSLPDGTLRARLSNSEINKLEKLGNLFALDVFLVVWSRRAENLEWTILSFSEFKPTGGKHHEAIAPAETLVTW